MSAPDATTPPAAAIDPADARWFPFDLDLPAGRIRFLHVAPTVLDESVFLDHRIALAERRPLDVARDGLALPPPATPAWLFHTSFCCSTLLARALHASPAVEVLKEPFALRRLSDARHAGAGIDEWIDPVARLLARRWHAGSRTVIKPTHVALNLAPALLAATPGAPAVLLHSGLADFIVSNLKKPPETKDKVGRLAARLVADAGWPPALLERAGQASGWAGLVAAQWLATMALADAALAAAPDRVLPLRDRELLADVPAQVARVATHLGLPVSPSTLALRAAAEAGRHAKATDVAYDAAQREREASMLRERFAPMIDAALAWARAEPAALPAHPALRATVD